QMVDTGPEGLARDEACERARLRRSRAQTVAGRGVAVAQGAYPGPGLFRPAGRPLWGAILVAAYRQGFCPVELTTRFRERLALRVRCAGDGAVGRAVRPQAGACASYRG